MRKLAVIVTQVGSFIFVQSVLLTFYKLEDTVNTAIHSVANNVRHGNNEKESEFAMSSISSISGSETNEG
jgi:hypothetical protein